MRCFLAIEPDKQAKDQINDIIIALKRKVSDSHSVRWVSAHYLHITLLFLANISIEQVNQLNLLLNEIIPTLASFSLTFTYVDIFPNRRHPVAIALLPLIQPNLHNLADIVKERAEQVGIETEKRLFRPHLTLGRIKNKQLDHLFTTYDLSTDFIMPVNQIKLLQSINSLTGVNYKMQGLFNLGIVAN